MRNAILIFTIFFMSNLYAQKFKNVSGSFRIDNNLICNINTNDDGASCRMSNITSITGGPDRYGVQLRFDNPHSTDSDTPASCIFQTVQDSFVPLIRFQKNHSLFITYKNDLMPVPSGTVTNFSCTVPILY
jgi:hypothetical protein